MPGEHLHPILRHLQRHFPGAGSRELTDLQLLERFAHHKDEAAFAALVQRHGPMVQGVCRRVLRRAEDAEDAFQATFLVLARKATAVAWRESVDRWLYQVAYRLAAEARARNARRDALERQASQRLRPAGAKQEGLSEVCAVLDEALHELPARYQEPLALCYLHGLTREQAAGRLGWSLRTLERRLAQGRERLRKALTRRGVTLSAALLAGPLTGTAADAAVPTRLVAATARAAVSFGAGKAGWGGGISATAAALAGGALRGTAGVPPRIGALLALLLGLAAGGLSVFVAIPENATNPVLPGGAEPAQAARTDPPAVRVPAQPPQADETLPPRQDRLGDPLPPGAVARMGSSRLRHPTDRWGFYSFGTVVSPDGKTLLTINHNGFRAWNLGTGQLLYPIRDEFGQCPAFSPDGRWLAVAGKGVIHLRDPATGRKLRRIPATGELPRQPERLAFSADGRRLAAALHEGEILVFDTATGRQAGSLDVQGTGELRSTFGVYSLAFAPDGRTLLSLGWDPDARLSICHWDLAKQRLLQRVVPASPRFSANSALSQDGRLFADTSGRGPVTLWDTQTGQVRCNLQGDRNRADYGLSFSSDAKTLATACAEDDGRNASVSLWDTATGELRRRVRVPRTRLLDLRHLSPDGRLLLFTVRYGCGVRLWDLATGQEVLEQEAHASSVASLAFTQDGRSIVSGAVETVRVWDARTGQQRQVMSPHSWFVNRVMARPDGRTAVSGGMDGIVRVHDLTTGREVRRCLLDRQPDATTPRGNQILQLGLAPDGRTAATLSTADKAACSRLHVWDLDSGRTLVRRERAGRAEVATFSGDARVLVSAREVQDLASPAPSGPPRTVVVVEEVATGRELLTLLQPDHFGNLLALTPDGQSLVTTTFPSPDSRPDTQGPGTLRLWELATGRQRLAITSARGGEDHAFARLAVAPDGRTLATVRHDQTIQLWDLATGKELLRCPCHDAPAYCLAFSRDGKRLATGHMDSAILVWDVAAAYERRPRPDPAAARELESWWQDLAGDAPQAHRAIWSLAGVPAQAVPFLRDRLRPAVAVPADEVQRLVQELDAPHFPRREEASRRLAEFGEEAEPTLRQALAGKPSAEARQRLERILAGPRPVPSPELLRSLRGLQVLEAIGDEPARRVLGRLAEGPPASRLTREARAAVDRLAHR
jgi:RNA polymerase sigma factor (sigma-70 family)